MTSCTVSLAAFVILSVTIMTARSANLPAPSCTWQGRRYAEGEVFAITPCIYCECTEGQTLCGTEECGVPQCVDAVQLPQECCPTCPNGPNCRGPGGRIIRYGEEVVVGVQVCRCQPSNYFSLYKAECEDLVG